MVLKQGINHSNLNKSAEFIKFIIYLFYFH